MPLPELIQVNRAARKIEHEREQAAERARNGK